MSSSPPVQPTARTAASWRWRSSTTHGRLLGAIGLAQLDWEDRRGEIGYWIAREARGRSVAARATRLISQHALDELGLERLELLAHPDNTASQRVALKAGYTREGLLRRYRRRRGAREDLVMFSLLAGEYP